MGGSGIEILKRIENSYNKNPEKIAFHSRAGEITYKNLWEKSDKLAAWIVEKKSDDFTPIVVGVVALNVAFTNTLSGNLLLAL